jgi:hypothetical protein
MTAIWDRAWFPPRTRRKPSAKLCSMLAGILEYATCTAPHRRRSPFVKRWADTSPNEDVEQNLREGNDVTYNPELGFHGYVDTIAYRMDVEPVVLEDVDTLSIIRDIFMRSGSHSEAEEAVRLHLEDRRKVAR